MNNSVFKCLLTIAVVFSCNIMQAVTKNIREYNLNGKAAIVINILFETGENDSSKFCSELKKYFKEDNQDEK